VRRLPRDQPVGARAHRRVGFGRARHTSSHGDGSQPRNPAPRHAPRRASVDGLRVERERLDRRRSSSSAHETPTKMTSTVSRAPETASRPVAATRASALAAMVQSTRSFRRPTPPGDQHPDTRPDRPTADPLQLGRRDIVAGDPARPTPVEPTEEQQLQGHHRGVVSVCVKRRRPGWVCAARPEAEAHVMARQDSIVEPHAGHLVPHDRQIRAARAMIKPLLSRLAPTPPVGRPRTALGTGFRSRSIRLAASTAVAMAPPAR
jgi:hypothetical protein